MNRLADLNHPPSIHGQRRGKTNKRAGQFCLSLVGSLGLLASPATVPATLAAEKVYVSYSAFERAIPIEELELYANEGRVTGRLKSYFRYIKPAQREQLRTTLRTRINLDPVTVSQFLYTTPGDRLLKRLGNVIRTESRLEGSQAIRATLILAAADPNGLTPLTVLRRFPSPGIRVDLGQALDIVGEVQALVNRTNTAVTAVRNQPVATPDPTLSVAQLPELRFQGPFSWKVETLQLTDPNRVRLGANGGARTFTADVYLPRVFTSDRLPVVVFSHGLGSDRTTYAYLASHLASYGYVVAVPEHPGSSAQQVLALLNGQANEVAEPTEFIDRPLDVKFLLDELGRLSQSDSRFDTPLNLDQVAVIGQSFGGYTALALAGAPINFAQLQKDCGANLNQSLNLSLLLQCQALALPKDDYTLADPRVKAVVAVNPLTSSIFGQDSLSQVKVPVMIMGGSADTVTPVLPEQLQPFTWLTTPNKYLVLVEGGTHFSTPGPEALDTGVFPVPPALVGPAPALARLYLNALSTAFLQTHLLNQPEYSRYLTSSYATAISRPPLRLSINQSLTAEGLR